MKARARRHSMLFGRMPMRPMQLLENVVSKIPARAARVSTKDNDREWIVGRRTQWNLNFPHGKDTREKIKLSTHEINAQVNGFWTLELAAPPSRKENKVKLKVLAADGKIRKDIGLTYPRLLENPNQHLSRVLFPSNASRNLVGWRKILGPYRKCAGAVLVAWTTNVSRRGTCDREIKSPLHSSSRLGGG
jgi:hypothetical protein